MANKHLSEILTAEMIMECKNNRICIVSGVGSGKNYFIENVLMNHGNVLCVSSRRAKVDEMLLLDICEEKIDWDSYKEKIVVTTNYGIEKLVKNAKFSISRKKVIEHFDFIVIDEAHSIYADARFSSSAYHVYSFIEHVINTYPDKKVVLMTGTVAPLKTYIEKDWTVFNLIQECINLVPRCIEFVNRKDLIKLIDGLNEEEKAIYFSNSTLDIIPRKEENLFSEISKILGEENISICMNMQKADELEVKDMCEETRNILMKNRKLADDKKMLLTTSALKEGINIEDKKITTVFCESHILSDIQQIAGRVRTGVDKFYIIRDAKQHIVSDDEINKMCLLAFYYVNEKYCEKATHFLEKFLLNSSSSVYKYTDYEVGDYEDFAVFCEADISAWSVGGKAVQYFIEYVQSTNPLIIYNHILNRFQINKMKAAESVRINKVFENECWYNDIQCFCEENNIEFIDTEKQREMEVYISLHAILKECEGKILVKKEKEDFLNIICKWVKATRKLQISTINKIFSDKKIPYYLKTVTTSRKKKSVRGLKILRTN